MRALFSGAHYGPARARELLREAEHRCGATKLPDLVAQYTFANANPTVEGFYVWHYGPR